MSLGVPSLAATCWVLAHFLGGEGSQGDIRVRLAVFIRPKQANILLCEGGLCSSQACKEKMAPVAEPHNTVCSMFCQEDTELSRVEPLSVGRMGLEGLPQWGGASQT